MAKARREFVLVRGNGRIAAEGGPAPYDASGISEARHEVVRTLGRIPPGCRLVPLKRSHHRALRALANRMRIV